MINQNFNIFNGEQWGEVLYHLSEKEDSAGHLIASKQAFQIKLMKPNTKEGLFIDLDRVMAISKQFLNNQAVQAKVKIAIKRGLQQLDKQVHDLVDKHKLCGSESYYTIVDFYEGVRELSPVESEKFEKAKIAPKQKVEDLALLSLDQMADLIKNVGKLQDQQIANMKGFIFKDEGRLFYQLMQRADANEVFDGLLPHLKQQELNNDKMKREKVFNFAYSVRRYESIFFRIENLSEKELEEANRCYAQNRMNLRKASIDERYSKKPIYEAWMKKRGASSGTVTQDRGSFERWRVAEARRSSYVVKDRGNEVQWDIERLQLLHLKLCKGEEGVTAGQIRESIVRACGGWTHLYCPHFYLEKNLEAFMTWFNVGLAQCQKGEHNPVIFSAQSYQRCVSLHPFQNGNGRISRLLMDYVLERFDLPPPILGDDIADALFPLDPINKQPGKFVMKIIQGIEQSRKLLSK